MRDWIKSVNEGSELTESGRSDCPYEGRINLNTVLN